MKLKILQITLLLSLFSLNGCKDFIEVDAPSNQIASSTIFLKEETANAAINGMYSNMSNSGLYFASGGPSVFLGLYADELYTTFTAGADVEFANSKLSIDNSYVYNNFWAQPYQIIYQANSCIAGLQNSPLPKLLREKLLGEAYFIRAFCYWNLNGFFGHVPLVLTADNYALTSKMTRTATVEVRNQILADLNQAKILLKNASSSTNKYRANYYTVLAMLSRVNTYLGNWNDVVSSSTEIIGNTANYAIENDLNNVFLIGSTEAIWQTLTANSSINTQEGFWFIPFPFAFSRPSYPMQANLINAFSGQDLRKSNWTATKVVNGQTFQFPLKYKVKQNTTKTEAQMMIRLGEIYLNRAEAKARLNDPTAIDDLNKIRNRAGLANLSGLSGQPLIDAVLQERRLELFAEWGLRWFDLKRTGRLDAVLGPLKSSWVSTASLFPIPNGERIASPNLTQNPGY